MLVAHTTSEMALMQAVKFLVNQRLSAAAEDILGTVGHIITEFEDEALSLKQQIDHQCRLLDMVLAPYAQVHRAGWYNNLKKMYADHIVVKFPWVILGCMGYSRHALLEVAWTT